MPNHTETMPNRTETMNETKITKGRIEAFSDGVVAIIITIMVLELKVPHGANLAALTPLLPVFLSYILSFIYVGIYWNNHHHMFQAVHKINGAVLWANLHLLFWLSLIPFVTGWMGENHGANLPAVLYGIVLFMAAIAFTIRARTLISANGKDSLLAKAIGKDHKTYLSLGLYLSGIVLSCFNGLAGATLYALVALIWLVPDRRIEKHLQP
jgi:uncharacterized membrane protein